MTDLTFDDASVRNTPFLYDCREIYTRAVRDRLIVIDTGLPTTVDDITAAIETAKTKHDNMVVIIDSFEHIAPSGDPRSSGTRAETDGKILALKQLANRMTVPILVTAKFKNSVSAAPEDVFRNSGQMENLADVLWCLRPSVADRPEFIKLPEYKKTLIARELCTQDTVPVTLNCVKNRFTTPAYKVFFRFHVPYCAFEPCEPPDPDDMDQLLLQHLDPDEDGNRSHLRSKQTHHLILPENK